MGGRLAGKSAVVTGAGQGLGRTIALLFAAEGARVLAVDVTGAEEEVAAEARGDVVPARCDVTDEAQVETLFDMCGRRFGGLDVLCNNAAVIHPLLPLDELDLATFDRVLDVNLRGAFLTMKYGVPLMLSGAGGSIVNISSISASYANPGTAAYGASKAGLLELTRVAAMDYARRGIRANCVCPGTMETPMNQAQPPERRELLASQVPMRRIGEPQEVAAVALFLASDEASYVTGQGWLVDGGRSAT